MGLLRGIIQLTGSFGGLSFYQTRNGVIRVRTTGGFKGEHIKTRPNYQRTRENALEFKHVVAVGSFLRLTLQAYLRPMHIPYGHNSVVQLFHRIKNLDTVHIRGARRVALGLQTEEGRALMDGFEFDPRHAVEDYFRVGYTLYPEVGQLVLAGFDSNQVHFPQGATRVEVRFILFRMDFEMAEASALSHSNLSFGRNETIPPTTLSVSLPEGSGMLIGLIGIGYYQEISGQDYPLQERGLRIIL